MDELEGLPALLQCLNNQNYAGFELWICVNQPDSWWGEKEKIGVCKRNIETISELKKISGFPVHVIDKSSPGLGWDNKKYGVGQARKTVMDAINRVAAKEDIILCLDGDTAFGPEYFASIIKSFSQFPQANAISVPYLHLLTGSEDADRAILRYEIYMRYYAINMLRIGSPYAFTALGSAIACTVSAYRSVGGITPHKSGEDFYFLQKLRKFGPVLIAHPQKVYPAARFSDRVFFGTGPAMIKGAGGDWQSYPVFNFSIFDEVEETFKTFQGLFEHDIETPMSAFLMDKFKPGSIWQPLRENFKSVDKFVRACQQKVDGLRILQYIKWRHNQFNLPDEESLFIFLQQHCPDDPILPEIDWISFSFELSGLEVLGKIRDSLVEKEETWQKQIKILG
ncbi:MAG: hypothetical protein B6D64_06915 [Bacteroidetes bacterium 4484_276]|nr:MAG: hypothetical protein B6D64_06915 [Bacteroidetes bacterium 4484_276]